MPDLPGAEDEPYDRRFAKWMIKNKVGLELLWGQQVSDLRLTPAPELTAQPPFHLHKAAKLVPGAPAFSEPGCLSYT